LRSKKFGAYYIGESANYKERRFLSYSGRLSKLNMDIELHRAAQQRFGIGLRGLLTEKSLANITREYLKYPG
jgi:hypothetical protein